MLNRLYCSKLLLVIFTVCFSCGSDDAYTALEVNVMDDVYQLYQNNNLEMNVLENDSNIPHQGTWTVGNVLNGTVEILDSGTPNDISDDKLKYTPSIDFIGDVNFSYTICNNSNCDAAMVTISVLPNSPVNVDLDELPYDTLSEYHFFEGDLKDLNPVFGVLPYDLIAPLFSDYAKKKRFIWMPDNVSAAYVDDYTSLDFPTGTILIKSFYYDNVLPDNSTKIIETRLMIKQTEGWTFANYEWNEAQTEALFTTDEEEITLDWIEEGESKHVVYRIPPFPECFTCHNKYEVPLPIGPKPQNLNRLFQYGNGNQNQLAKWVEMGYLNSDVPSDIDSVVSWDDESEDLETRVRSYLDINCAHCHSDQSYCEYANVRFEFHKTNEPVNMGVCVDGTFLFDNSITQIVAPGNHLRSIIYNRINTTDGSIRMPLLGRTLIHEDGTELIQEWINSLETNCE
ncbi:MAG TPA: hypothetical protein VKZ98_03455 [Aquaticitalea sp.]|nr:hypothetical protein [Aquaticitalea sp.]